MGKWEKRAAIIAAGSLVVGTLFIGAGALLGGVRDVKAYYQPKAQDLTTKTLEMTSLEELNLVSDAVAVTITEGDVTKVSVSYPISWGDLSDFSQVNQVQKSLTLQTPFRNRSSIIHTDVLALFGNFTHQPQTEAVTITVPKGSGIKRFKAELSDTFLSIQDITIEQVDIQDSDGIIELANSQLLASRLELHSSALMSQKSDLTQLTLYAEDSDMTFDGKLADSQVTLSDSLLNLEELVYQGGVAISATESDISVLKMAELDKVRLELKMVDGDVVDDWQVEASRLDSDDMVEWLHESQQKQATIRITGQDSQVNLKRD